MVLHHVEALQSAISFLLSSIPRLMLPFAVTNDRDQRVRIDERLNHVISVY